MNNFTKEELDLVKGCVLRCKLYDKLFIDQFDNLDKSLIKLQSMIDNYCEHLNKTSRSAIVSYGSSISVEINECIKCGEFYI